VTCLALALAPSLPAQSGLPDGYAWVFRSSAFVSGDSHGSTPEGYKVYSAIGLQVGLDRRLSGHLALGLVLRPESREVDSIPAVGVRSRQGSLDLLASSLMIRYRLRSGAKVQPYVGGGANFTFAWEKTGVLDSLGVSPSLGPAAQAGVDLRLSSYVLFNVDVSWNFEQLDLETATRQIVQLDIDPLTLSVGAGFRI